MIRKQNSSKTVYPSKVLDLLDDHTSLGFTSLDISNSIAYLNIYLIQDKKRAQDDEKRQ